MTPSPRCSPVIVSTALVSALGAGLEHTWERLLAGASGVAPLDAAQRFDPSCYVTPYAACVPNLDAEPPHSRVFPLLRLLLQDPALGAPADVLSDAALFFATTKGGVDMLERHVQGGGGANADEIFPQACTELLAGRLGLHRPAQIVSAACASSTIALGRAAAAVAYGRVHTALMVCADLVSEFVFSGFSALRALSPTPCRPFDQERDGLTLGEGAAALLVMSRERAEELNLTPLARVAGWAAANDATHITAPDRLAGGLIRAMGGAMDMGGVTPADIAAICAHGTGTVYNDAMELTAFEHIFQENIPPFCSTKGALGHTMGAAGGMELALACKSLESGILPPTVGMDAPDARALGAVSARPQNFSGDYFLSCNSGFGGVNGVVILERFDAGAQA